MLTQFAQHWLIGEAPWQFMLEVALRFVIIYFSLLLVLRLFGRRFAGQLSILELAIMIMLGAAIGAPLQTPEKGILPTLVLLLALLASFRLLSWLSFRSHRVEVLSQGDATTLIVDGRMALDNVRQAKLSRDRIFSELRALDVQHLGEVRRAWLEPAGRVSLLRYRASRPGLWLLPEQNPEFDQRITLDDCYACAGCGHVIKQQEKPEEACEYCQGRSWHRAVKRLGSDKPQME